MLQYLQEIEEDLYQSDLLLCKDALRQYIDDLELQNYNLKTTMFLKNSFFIAAIVISLFLIIIFR